MKKICAISLLINIFLTSVHAAADSLLLEKNKIFLFIESIIQNEDEVSLSISIISLDEKSETITFIDPMINGSSAYFSSGWNSLEITLKAKYDNCEVLTICSDMIAEEEIQTVSFRCVTDGIVSKPIFIRLSGDTFSIAITEDVELAIVDRSPLFIEMIGSSFVLHDNIVIEDVDNIETANVNICIIDETEKVLKYIPYGKIINVSISDEGEVTAIYSGIVEVLDCAPNFPLPMQETCFNEGYLVKISNIALSGEAAFFAQLYLEIKLDNSGNTEILSCMVDSPDIGGELNMPPVGLFSNLRASHDMVSFAGKDNSIPYNAGPFSISEEINTPLKINLLHATDLGNIAFYIEYELKDGTYYTHGPIRIER